MIAALLNSISGLAHGGNAMDEMIGTWDMAFPFLKDNWLFTGVLSVVFIAALVTCVLNRRCWKFASHHIKSIALVVFMLGVVLYYIGFNDNGSENNVLALVLRASISSLEMFVSGSDLIEVKHVLHGSPLYMTIFSITHFSAVFVSAIFVLRLFGQRLMSRIYLWSKRHSRCDKVYLFIGINENSMILAESIAARRNDLLVFVKSPKEHHAHSSRYTFSHFFQSSDSDVEQYAERIEALHGVIVGASRKISIDIVDDRGWKAFFGKIGLSQMWKTMARFKEAEIFLLSDDFKGNIEIVSALKKQDSLATCYMLPGKFNIYCHARRNNFTDGVLSCPGLKYKVHLIDSSLLSVLQLKENGEYMKSYGRNHPVNFVDVDTANGTVSSVFTSMIIGFGETGQDALRFLYEFSSFVKKVGKSSDGDDYIEAQDRKIYVADKDMGRLKTKFLTEVPALAGTGSIEWLEDVATDSQAFWNKLGEIIDRLNYVVVAVGNDEETMSIAIRLFEYAYRYRSNMDKFRIYVRMRNDSSKREIDAIDRYKIEDDNTGTKVPGIEVFGTNRAVFSYDNVAKTSKEADAKDYFYQYNILSVEIDRWITQQERESKITEIKQLQAEGVWRSRRDGIVQHDTIENEVKISYQEEQDRSDVCHIYTKLVLAGVIDKGNHINQERLRRMVEMTTRDNNNEYSRASGTEFEQLMHNLSYCEHLRWNAKMELLGFVHGAGKDFKKKTHHCIVDCNELIRNEHTKGTFIYDEGVVELSFAKALQWVEGL